MNKSTHGGKRKGAGRPPSVSPRKQRSLKASDQEWEKIVYFADQQNMSTNEYIIQSALANNLLSD